MERKSIVLKLNYLLKIVETKENESVGDEELIARKSKANIKFAIYCNFSRLR